MKEFKTLAQAKISQAVDMAMILNFTRKRTESSKLEVCESVIKALGLAVEPADMAQELPDLIEAKKAEKVEAEPATKKSNKMAVDTLTGSTRAKAATMPVIATDQPVIVTSAQNNTALAPVFRQLETLAEHMGAKLIVLPVYYNKTAYDQHAEDEAESFADPLMPYLLQEDSWLYERNQVRLAAEAAVLPTAKLPINAAAQLNQGELFTIIGSPKQQHKTIATLSKDRTPKAWATGGCTVFNYKRGRAGSEAEPNHVFGAVLLHKGESGEVNSTNIRQADNGSIMLYLDDTAETIHINSQLQVTDGLATEMTGLFGQPAIKLGDLHCEMYDPTQWNKALGFVAKTNPKFVAADDLLHFSTRSHHNRNDSKHLYATRDDRVTDDLNQVIKQLNELAAFAPVYVTESNHNSALDQWLSDISVKIDFDAHNAKIYHLLKWLVMDTLDDGIKDKNALQIALENADLTKLGSIPDSVEFGRMDVPKYGYKYDFSQHGHKGASGSQGSPAQLAKINLYLVQGHTHSPMILNQHFVTGVTARLNQGYNRGGASAWDHAHVMEHPNGECQLINTNPQC